MAKLETVSLSASRAHPGSFPSCFLALTYGQCLFISQMRVWLLSVSQGRISLQSYQHVAATHVLPLFQLLSSHWHVYYGRTRHQERGMGKWREKGGLIFWVHVHDMPILAVFEKIPRRDRLQD